MIPKVVQLTDVEFAQLVGESPLRFAARLRAAAVARDLRDRASTVAADLRRWMAAGQVADPAAVARIADGFDHLGHELEAEITLPPHVDDNGAAEFQDHNRLLRFAKTHDYEVEAWHSVVEATREASAA